MYFYICRISRNLRERKHKVKYSFRSKESFLLIDFTDLRACSRILKQRHSVLRDMFKKEGLRFLTQKSKVTQQRRRGKTATMQANSTVERPPSVRGLFLHTQGEKCYVYDSVTRWRCKSLQTIARLLLCSLEMLRNSLSFFPRVANYRSF